MSVKIPSALKWLVSHHAHLAGEIERLNCQLQNLPHLLRALDDTHLRRLKAYESRRASLERKDASMRHNLQGCEAALAAVQESIRQHQIHVDISSIPAVKIQGNPMMTPHGQLTRRIMEAFRVIGVTELGTGALTSHVMASLDMPVVPTSFKIMRKIVRKRLKDMASRGRLIRISMGRNGAEGVWGLPATPPVVRRVGRPSKRS